jgi:hypothetical protein
MLRYWVPANGGIASTSPPAMVLFPVSEKSLHEFHENWAAHKSQQSPGTTEMCWYLR